MDLCPDCYDSLEEWMKINKTDEKVGRWNHGICNNCKYDWSKDAPIADVPNFLSKLWE